MVACAAVAALVFPVAAVDAKTTKKSAKKVAAKAVAPATTLIATTLPATTSAPTAALAVSPPKVEVAAKPSAKPPVYPNQDVIDLATGKVFNLAQLGSVAKPTLMFIWAPN